MASLTYLQEMAAFFRTGKTKSYDFRKKQLEILRNGILEYEDELHAALYKDLHKSPEECWVTETGFVMAEIKDALRHLRRWMRPEKVSTNLANLPSRSRVYAEPLGVVLIISPWNYPVNLLFTPLVGAIAAGNCCILKPSEHAPATGDVLIRMINKIFDPGYIRIAEGEGHIIIPEMMKAFRFHHVFYTGSTATGKKIYEMAASRLVPVTLELGGKSPCVVEEDADIAMSAKRITLAKFSNAGQMCVAPDYILVHNSVRNKLLDAIKENIKKFFGDKPEESAYYGRIINEAQFERLAGYLESSNLAFGGYTNKEKLFIEPTILTHVKEGDDIMQEEIFGPILPILSFGQKEEALEIIERNPNPLAFYVFTSSRECEQYWLKAVSFGGGCRNNASLHLTNYHLPFGGRGDSGIGHYHGKYSFDIFSHKKAWMKTPGWFDPSLKYPPYAGKMNILKKLIG
ncbi:MAG: aldehyde dehydrogenase [Ferruginibacter sp.]